MVHPEPEPDHIKVSAVALAEAARHANIEVMSTLPPICRYSQGDLQEALISASSCYNEGSLNLLTAHIVEHFKGFRWPAVLLNRAAQFRRENVVRELLDLGISLEAAVTVDGFTPLHIAARHGPAGVVRVLLEEKAKLTAVDGHGLTPLHIASKYNHATVVRLLLDAQIGCNSVNDDKNTALDFACGNGNHMVIQMLLKQSECDMGCDRQGSLSSLSITTKNGSPSCAQLLLEKGAKTEIQGKGWSPLCHAAVKGHAELCQLLLKHGANPKVCVASYSILSLIAGIGNLQIVTILVEHGAEIDATDADGQTALQKASKNGRKDIVAYLLDWGAAFYHADNSGFTSAHLAAQFGWTEILRLLIAHGANPQSQTNGGATALHLSYDHPETTKLLLKIGATMNSVTKNGCTPLDFAAATKQPEVVTALLAYNADPNILHNRSIRSALTIATMNGNAEVVRLLLEAGANVNQQSDNKNFPLQYAFVSNLEHVLRILMEYNPMTDLVNNHGNTALHRIHSGTSVSIVKILINNGADPNIRNNDQDTGICNAARFNNSAVLKYLAQKAELDVVGTKHGGPLLIACYESNLHLVKILVDAGADVNLVELVFGTPLQSASDCTESSSKEEQKSVISYLINEAKVQLGIVGGLYGCAVNAACGRSSIETVNLMLERGARIDVKGQMEGRPSTLRQGEA